MPLNECLWLDYKREPAENWKQNLGIFLLSFSATQLTLELHQLIPIKPKRCQKWFYAKVNYFIVSRSMLVLKSYLVFLKHSK